MECKFTKKVVDERELPCYMCDLIVNIGNEINKLDTDVNSLQFVKDLKELKKLYSTLKSSHKQCVGCGLCFGGQHMAIPTKFQPGIGMLCQYCTEYFSKVGQQRFLKSMEDRNVQNV